MAILDEGIERNLQARAQNVASVRAFVHDAIRATCFFKKKKSSEPTQKVHLGVKSDIQNAVLESLVQRWRKLPFMARHTLEHDLAGTELHFMQPVFARIAALMRRSAAENILSTFEQPIIVRVSDNEPHPSSAIGTDSLAPLSGIAVSPGISDRCKNMFHQAFRLAPLHHEHSADLTQGIHALYACKELQPGAAPLQQSMRQAASMDWTSAEDKTQCESDVRALAREDPHVWAELLAYAHTLEDTAKKLFRAILPGTAAWRGHAQRDMPKTPEDVQHAFEEFLHYLAHVAVSIETAIDESLQGIPVRSPGVLRHGRNTIVGSVHQALLLSHIQATYPKLFFNITDKEWAETGRRMRYRQKMLQVIDAWKPCVQGLVFYANASPEGGAGVYGKTLQRSLMGIETVGRLSVYSHYACYPKFNEACDVPVIVPGPEIHHFYGRTRQKEEEDESRWTHVRPGLPPQVIMAHRVRKSFPVELWFAHPKAKPSPAHSVIPLSDVLPPDASCIRFAEWLTHYGSQWLRYCNQVMKMEKIHHVFPEMASKNSALQLFSVPNVAGESCPEHLLLLMMSGKDAALLPSEALGEKTEHLSREMIGELKKAVQDFGWPVNMPEDSVAGVIDCVFRDEVDAARTR